MARISWILAGLVTTTSFLSCVVSSDLSSGSARSIDAGPDTSGGAGTGDAMAGSAGTGGNVAGDSSVDAGPADAREAAPIDAREATASDWCASQKPGFRLCSDFDLSAGLTQGFDIGLVTQGVGGSFVPDTDWFVSAPRSALGTANPFSAGQTSGDYITGTLWPLGATPPTLECALEWRPVALSTVANDYAHVVELAFYSDAGQASPIMTLSINMQGDGSLALVEYYATQSSLDMTHSIPLSVTTGTWLHVDVSLGMTASSANYQVSVGDTVAAGSSLAAPIPANSHATLEVGPAYFGGTTTEPSPGWTFAYDNVICY